MLRVLIVWLACSTLVVAAPPAPEQIDEWVRDLDSPKYRVREAAAKALVDAGPPAAIALGKAVRHAGGETAERALRLLGEIFEGDRPETIAAARKQLRRLVEAETHAAKEAKAILNRRRHAILAALTMGKAGMQYEDELLKGVWLETVPDLAEFLPLLKHFPELEYLSVATKQFGDPQVRFLVELPNLQRLNLYQSNIGDEGVKHLTGVKNLRYLPIGETRVTDAGLASIARLAQLEYLGLRGNAITDAGLKHVSKLTELTELHLGETRVTDTGLKHLSPLRKLNRLTLTQTAITDVGLNQLRALPDLRLLHLTKTKTTPEGRESLARGTPGLEIDPDRTPQ